MDEQHLVEQSKRGDKNAFTNLIELYQNKLYRTAYAILQDRYDAFDALQDCVLKAYLSIDYLRNDYYFKYWVNRILINSCNDIMRRRKKLVYMEDAGEAEGYMPGGDLQQRDVLDVTRLDIRAAMKRLGDKYRHILALHYYQDLSYEDIAEVLNCPVGTVKSRISYALKKLRDAYNNENKTEVSI